MKIPRVIITVKGGVAHIAMKDKGFIVEIIDYDNNPDGSTFILHEHEWKSVGDPVSTRTHMIEKAGKKL